MRATNTFGIQFIVRTNKSKNGLVPLYCRITAVARRVEISLKRSVESKSWNDDAERERGNSETIRTLNHFLEEVRARLVECYQEIQIEKQPITAAAIKDKFVGVKTKEHTLQQLVEYHNTMMKETLEW